jgi:diguanylate cyclase (GGDEF)-like protein
MTAGPISVLVADPDEALVARLAASGFVVSTALASAGTVDAVLLWAATRQALEAIGQRGDLPRLASDSAVVVLADMLDDDTADRLLAVGVEAVVPVAESDRLARAIRHAVIRKRAERAAKTAYATDLATGLPHKAQLLEYMTQLLALREREPAPMALLALRVEGYAAAANRLGSEAADLLRRKVAVRLRSCLRAGDVVAAIDQDTFGILLGQLEAQADGERVAAKVVRSLQQPLFVAGEPCPTAASVGLALYPAHGKDARKLLQRAVAQSSSLATIAGAGAAGRVERGPGAAANDETR